MDDYWNVDEEQKSVRFVDRFHKIHIAERNSSERKYVVWWETDKNPNNITSRSHMAWFLDKKWKSRSERRKARKCNRETETRTRQKNEMNLFYWSEWRRIQRHHLKCKTKIGNTKGSGNAMQKSVLSSMHTGNCFKNRKSQGIWSEDKIRLYHWSTWNNKTKKSVSDEEDAWRTHRPERAEFHVALQFIA